MSYDEVIEETDTHRVRIILDEYPENPREMGDCFASVLTQLSKNYLQPDDDYDQRIIDAWEHGRAAWKPNGVFCGTYHDTEKVERYARAFLGAVAVEWFDDGMSDSRIFGYITRQRVEELGIGNAADLAAILRAELDEYRAYAEGDVYGVVVEEKVREHVTVTRNGEPFRDDEDDVWVETDYPVWGHYGREYAEQAAREALRNYTKEDAR